MSNALKTQPAGLRGERLFPRRAHRSYWHLTCLRRLLEAVVAEQFTNDDTTTLVDYGCGNMPYRPLFEPHVGEYLGYDLPGNELAAGTLDPEGMIERESNSADFVLSSQVLEHVADPAGYLDEAVRVLKPDGKLILSTHGVWRYHPDPTDYWRWTCDGLRKVINDSGFTIISFHGMMGPAATALQLWQDATASRVPSWMRKGFTWSMQRLIERADHKCGNAARDRDACVYVVVAQPKSGDD